MLVYKETRPRQAGGGAEKKERQPDVKALSPLCVAGFVERELARARPNAGHG
jgi:hypothetical protein